MKHSTLKIAVLVLIGIALVGGMAGAQETGKYADFKAVMREMIDATYIYIEEMEAAESAEEVASAIENFALAMKELEPRMDAMDEKYPDISDAEFPAELAETMEEYAEMMVSMEAAMMKMFEYMMDPVVQEAMELMD
jgi:hypothetical protein